MFTIRKEKVKTTRFTLGHVHKVLEQILQPIGFNFNSLLGRTLTSKLGYISKGTSCAYLILRIQGCYCYE